VPNSVLAAQLYSVREYTKTPADIAKTLARVRKMGYTSVQLSALGRIDPHELAKLLKENGLTCCATHASVETLRKEPQRVIDEHRIWNCSLAAISWYFPDKQDARVWIDFAKECSQIAKVLEAGGLHLGYHNHAHELTKWNGKTSLDLMIEHTSPSFWFEIDTNLIVKGGGDPVQWVGKVKGRIPAIHLKDLGVKPDATQQSEAVGEGNVNFPPIIAAARAAGTEFFIVELDPDDRDPFVLLETSLKNLHQMGLK